MYVCCCLTTTTLTLMPLLLTFPLKLSFDWAQKRFPVSKKKSFEQNDREIVLIETSSRRDRVCESINDRTECFYYIQVRTDLKKT